MSERRKLVAIVLLAVVTLTGCVTAGSSFKPSKTIHATAGKVIKVIEDGQKAAYSLKGMARVRLATGKIDTTVNEIVAVKRPFSVRLETLGFFGNPVVVFASDGNVFNIAAEKRFISGKLSSSRMVSLPFPFNILRMDEIATIFLGSTPIIKFESSEIIYSDAKDLYTIVLHSKDGVIRQTIVVDAKTLRPLKSEIADDGLGSILSMTFARYEDVDGTLIPKEIDVQISPNPSNLHINYEEIELNSRLQDDLFIITSPDGSEITIFN